jgi:hypothetical protein
MIDINSFDSRSDMGRGIPYRLSGASLEMGRCSMMNVPLRYSKRDMREHLSRTQSKWREGEFDCTDCLRPRKTETDRLHANEGHRRLAGGRQNSPRWCEFESSSNLLHCMRMMIWRSSEQRMEPNRIFQTRGPMRAIWHLAVGYEGMQDVVTRLGFVYE